MNKILFFVFFTFASISIGAQSRIVMEKTGGVYRIPCIVNGAKMKFIFDTGASSVSLSNAMSEYLYDNGYIKDSDFKGIKQFRVADGRTVSERIVNLRDLEIAGKHLYNVEASISQNQNAPLLLGQSAIQKLGEISINGNILTIKSNNSDSKLPEQSIEYDIAYLNKEINRLWDSGLTASALRKAMNAKDTGNYDVELDRYLVQLYMIEGLYDRAIEEANFWFDNFFPAENSEYTKMVLFSKYQSYIQKGDLLDAQFCVEDIIEKTTDCKDKAYMYGLLGQLYNLYKEDYNNAITYYLKAVNCICIHYRLPYEDVVNMICGHEDMGTYFKSVSTCYALLSYKKDYEENKELSKLYDRLAQYNGYK